TTSYTKGTRYPNWPLSGTADYGATSSFTIGVRGGRYQSDVIDFNVNNAGRFVFADGTTNGGQAGVPAAEQHAARYSNIPSNNGIATDKQTRNFFQADAPHYAHMGSSPTPIKAGVQIARPAHDVIKRNPQNE